MRWYPAHCSQTPAGTDLVFLTDTCTGACHTMSRLQARVFTQLYGCRLPEQHAEQLLMCDVPGLNRDQSHRLVADWIRQGLLQPESQLYPEAGAPDPDLVPDAHFTLCCCTASRPAAFRAWLHEHTSWVTHSAELIQELLVIEDSRAGGDIALNHQAVQDYERVTEAPIRMLDRAARKSLIDDLCGKIAPQVHAARSTTRELLEFGLLGQHEAIGPHSSLGAARNTALMYASAPILNFCDDDIRAQFRYLPSENQEQPDMQPDEQPQLLSSPLVSVRFFPDLSTLEEASTALVDYPVYRNIMRAFAAVQQSGMDLSSAGPELLALLRGHGRVSVHAVSCGYSGARPYSHPFRTFLFRNEHAEHLLEDAVAFERIRTSPLLIRHSTGTILDGGLGFSPGFSAVDARNPALPFFPLGRREDDIYRTMYRMCFPHQLFANLPAAAFHDPQYKAPFTTKDSASYPPDLGTWIHLLTQRFAARLNHTEGAERIAELALSFQELSYLNPEQLLSFLLPLHQAHYRAMINHVQRELELYDGPPWWSTERRHALSVLHSEHDAGPLVTNDQSREYLTIFRLWGDFLTLWPQIVEHTRI